MQLHNLLRKLIVSRRWKHGERIPTETQLSNHLEISRTTVRIALQLAEVEGLIKRNAGRGTFVSYDPDQNTPNRLVGYVTQSFDNEIHRILLSSAETELRASGYKVIFSKVASQDDEVEVLQQLLDDNVTGLLLYPNAESPHKQQDVLRQYQMNNIPIVFIDRPVHNIDADCVTSDNFNGAYTVVQHLIDLGHQRIVYVKPDIDNLLTIDERYRGYAMALSEQGLNVADAWQVSTSDRHEVFEADIFQVYNENASNIRQSIVNHMEAASPGPTALFCANDALAIITMKCVMEMGLSVPNDISVAGFDGISLASYIEVPLTTIVQDAHEIGQRAARILLDRLDGNFDPVDQHHVPVHLQIRASTSTPILESS